MVNLFPSLAFFVAFTFSEIAADTLMQFKLSCAPNEEVGNTFDDFGYTEGCIPASYLNRSKSYRIDCSGGGSFSEFNTTSCTGDAMVTTAGPCKNVAINGFQYTMALGCVNVVETYFSVAQCFNPSPDGSTYTKNDSVANAAYPVGKCFDTGSGIYSVKYDTNGTHLIQSYCQVPLGQEFLLDFKYYIEADTCITYGNSTRGTVYNLVVGQSSAPTTPTGVPTMQPTRVNEPPLYCATYTGDPHLMRSVHYRGQPVPTPDSQHCTGEGWRTYAVTPTFEVLVYQDFSQLGSSAPSTIRVVKFVTPSANMTFDAQAASWPDGETVAGLTSSVRSSQRTVLATSYDLYADITSAEGQTVAEIRRWVWDNSGSLRTVLTFTMCYADVSSGLMKDGCSAVDIYNFASGFGRRLEAEETDRAEGFETEKPRGFPFASPPLPHLSSEGEGSRPHVRRRRLYSLHDACSSLNEPFRTNCNIDLSESGDTEMVEANVQAESSFTAVVEAQTTAPTMANTNAPTVSAGFRSSASGALLAAMMFVLHWI